MFQQNTLSSYHTARFAASLPEIAARAKCEKLRVVKTVPAGKALTRFSSDEVAGDLPEGRCQLRLPVKGAKFSTEYKLCRFPGAEVRR